MAIQLQILMTRLISKFISLSVCLTLASGSILRRDLVWWGDEEPIGEFFCSQSNWCLFKPNCNKASLNCVGVPPHHHHYSHHINKIHFTSLTPTITMPSNLLLNSNSWQCSTRTHTHSTGFQMQNSIIMFYLQATIVHVQHIHTQEARANIRAQGYINYKICIQNSHY